MADKEEGGEGSASARPAEDDRSPESVEDNLSFLDKLKCMMYSKVERDAFLIEKLEKEEKKKAKKAAEAAAGKDEGIKKEKSLFGKMKSAFTPQKEHTETLQGQGQESQQERQGEQNVQSAEECSKEASGGDAAKP